MIEAVLAGDWDRPDSERLEESLMVWLCLHLKK